MDRIFPQASPDDQITVKSGQYRPSSDSEPFVQQYTSYDWIDDENKLQSLTI